jgi:hypothetical protein
MTVKRWGDRAQASAHRRKCTAMSVRAFKRRADPPIKRDE